MNLFSAPTVEYCEKATNYFIARPGYAISNLPYIFLGLYLVSRKDKLAKLFGIISILIGAASFFYDSTFTLLSQIIDLSVMFIFINFLIVLNLKRLKNIKNKYLVSVVLISYLVFISITILLGGSSGRILFGIGVLLQIISEIYLKVRNKDVSILNWSIAVAIFILGFGIWLFDGMKIWCDPNNIFNGRAIFHYLTTISIYYLYKHFKQFENTKFVN